MDCELLQILQAQCELHRRMGEQMHLFIEFMKRRGPSSVPRRGDTDSNESPPNTTTLDAYGFELYDSHGSPKAPVSPPVLKRKLSFTTPPPVRNRIKAFRSFQKKRAGCPRD